MQAKSDLTEDVDTRRASAGGAAPTPGVGQGLDQAREASLADEGGASGARVESQDLDSLRRIAADLPIAHLHPESATSDLSGLPTRWIALAALAVAGLLAVALYRSR